MDSMRRSIKVSGEVEWELSRSDKYPFLFMFVRRSDGRYIIYKIDALGSYKSGLRQVDMLPLLVFRYGILPDCACAFAYIDPYFYIVGEKKQDVYTLKKKDLINLKPTGNARGAKYVTQITTPMSSDKPSSLAFAYRNNLYVLSKTRTTPKYITSYHEFELYSPINNSWTALGPKPLRDCDVNSYVVIGTMVYFTTSLHAVMSFNLERAHWSTIYDPYGVTYIHKDRVPNSFKYFALPTFEQQIHVIQNRIFGSVYTNGQTCFSFCASPSKPSAKFFLRPPLDQDNRVLNALCYCSCGIDNKVSFCSSHIITMDASEEIMCGVCYGIDFSSDDPSNYVALTFFKVPEDSQSSSSNSVGVTSDSLLSLEEDNGFSNCFKFDRLHNTRFVIKTKQPTSGIISTCIFV